MAISANNDRLTIIIPRELKAQLKELADSENRSVSNYIVTLLEEHVNKKGAYRDIPRPLGIDIANVADTAKPEKANRVIEVKVDPYEVDFDDKIPKKTKSNFIRDGIDIELNDPNCE